MPTSPLVGGQVTIRVCNFDAGSSWLFSPHSSAAAARRTQDLLRTKDLLRTRLRC
jgi:hypothetical protein